MTNAWPMVPLGEVLKLQRRWLRPESATDYVEIGVRSYGNGIFHKTPVSGASLGNKRVLRIEPGDIVFMNVFAWEGAVAVAGKDESGKIGSHRFATYTPIGDRADVQFLNLFFKTEAGRELLGRISPGSALRNRTMSLSAFAEQPVPLPPLSEQRRIVARVEALIERRARVQQLAAEVTADVAAFVISTHIHLSGDRRLRVGDFLALDEDAVPIEQAGEYPQVGLRGFGGGIFARGMLRGMETTYRTFNRLHEGLVVLSQVKGWEGAIAVCPATLAGHFASPEYRTFRCVPDKALPEYMDALVLTPWFHAALKNATHGQGARRERVRPERFLELEMPIPGIDHQAKAAAMFAKLSLVSGLRTAAAAELDALLPSILDRVFKGAL